MGSLLVKNAPQKVEPKMAPVPVDLASAVFVCNKIHSPSQSAPTILVLKTWVGL